MMTAQQVISDAYDAGITLTVVGGELKIKGKRGDDFDRIVGLLKPVKAAVIEALTPVETSSIDLVSPSPIAIETPSAPVDPRSLLGQVISQAQMDELLDRGLVEGFGVQGEWQSDEYPCEWKLVRVWDLPTGYNGDKLPEVAPLEVELTLDAETTDLFCFVGAIVTRPELDILQARINAKGWSIHTLRAGDALYITGVSESDNWHVDGPGPKCVLGSILVGDAEGAGNCFYTVKPGSPLYKRFATGKEYKAWLWPKIKDNLDGNADVIAELYTIINADWVGADIYIAGDHADVVVAAANYLLSKYSVDGLPILTKGKT
jgi:hypothetical protein